MPAQRTGCSYLIVRGVCTLEAIPLTCRDALRHQARLRRAVEASLIWQRCHVCCERDHIGFAKIGGDALHRHGGRPGPCSDLEAV